MPSKPSVGTEALDESNHFAGKLAERGMIPSPAISTTTGISMFGHLNTDALGIGFGYSPTTGEKRGKSVQFTPGNEETELYKVAGRGALEPGQRTEPFYLKQVTSTESLKSLLNVSVQASFGWGLNSADGSVNYLKSNEFTQYCNYVYASIRVINQAEMLRVEKLTDAAVAVAQRSPAEFFENFGEEFVYGRRTGGELTAVVKFLSQSSGQQQDVSAAINASIGVGGFGTEVASDYESKLRHLSTLASTEIFIIRNGGLGNIPTIKELIEAAHAFPKTVDPVTGHPVSVDLLTSSYRGIEGLPAGFTGWDRYRAFMLSLQQLGGWLDQCFTVRADLAYIRQNIHQFELGTNEDISQAWRQNEANIIQIHRAAETLRQRINDVGFEEPLPEINFVNFQPRRKGEGGGPVTAPKPTPTWGWVREHGGRPFFEVYTREVPAQDLRQPNPLMPQRRPILEGMWTLPNPQDKQIYRVDFACENLTNVLKEGHLTPCMECWNPNTGQNGREKNSHYYEIRNNGASFYWKRDYGNFGPIRETYTVYYEVWEQINKPSE